MIIDTTHPAYQDLRNALPFGKNNGAYFYSQEIVKNIIPNVQTDRHWNTLGNQGLGSFNHSIVFIHHNIDHDRHYAWLNQYKDQVLVCSVPQTYRWALRRGKAIFLPLSIDTDYVRQFATEKTKDACYAGNRWKFKEKDIAKYVPRGVDFPPEDLDRAELLRFMASYKRVYAIGRTALEAKCLGAKIEVCDHRFPDPDFWTLLDNKQAAELLQHQLDKIDK